MPVKFGKRLIDAGDFEAASVFDVNNDGVMDIVCGGYWYEGPDFKKSTRFATVPSRARTNWASRPLH